MTNDWVEEAFNMPIDKTIDSRQNFYTNNKRDDARKSGKHYLVLVTYTSGQQEVCGACAYSKLAAKHACKRYSEKTNVQCCDIIRDPKEVGGKIIKI